MNGGTPIAILDVAPLEFVVTFSTIHTRVLGSIHPLGAEGDEQGDDSPNKITW